MNGPGADGIEYLFLTTAPLVEVGGVVTCLGASARLGSVAPARALNGLGQQARVLSTAGDLTPVEDAVRGARCVVFGEMFATKEGWTRAASQYRRLLGAMSDRRRRAVFGIADDHFSEPEFAAFYREALPDCLAVTVISDALAQTVRALTSRPVIVAPEPSEGTRGKPQAVVARRLPAPLAWLARRAGVSLDHWRVRLLWFGYPQNLPPLLELVPALEEYAQRYPLLLTCVTSPVGEIGELLRRMGDPERNRLRVQFVPWSPGAVDSALGYSDLVLIPSEYRNPVKQAKSPNRLVAGLHGGRFVVAHPLPAYAPYSTFAWIGEDLCAGVDWAVRHPREVAERVVRGQAYVDERHSPDAVARFWLDVFRLKN